MMIEPHRSRAAQAFRAIYFLLVLGFTVGATSAAYDGAWGGAVFLALVVVSFVVPVVRDGVLWNR